MISKEIFSEAMNMNGSFGMITVSNVDIDNHGNRDYAQSSIQYDFSQDFLRNSHTQEMPVYFCKQQQLNAY